MPDKKTSVTIQTVGRIASIMRCFTKTENDLGVMEISREIGIHKSTTSRLLSALHQEGFVAKNPETGKYRLGLGLVNLAGVVLEKQNLRQAAQNYIRALAELTQETINISILDDNECINIETVRSPKSISYAGRLGRRTPLHCTSTGKVQLTYMSPERRQKILSQPLEAYTSRTITNPATLRIALAEVWDQGYAISSEEFEVGLVAIAAPIWDRFGEVVGALSISGPTYRMDAETLQKYISPLIEAAQNISKALGHIKN
jgi:DNA-binding IclR family transcriptional regulator